MEDLSLNVLITRLGLNANDSFENMLMELLTDVDTYYSLESIDESFWDPVIINLPDSKLDSIKSILLTECNDCAICAYSKRTFKELPCCNNHICFICTRKWFDKSVYCPYCKADIRDLEY